jgi:Na+-driven multidrug efflux pump
MRFIGILLLIIGANAVEQDYFNGIEDIRWDTLIMMIIGFLLLFPNLISIFGDTNGKRK